MAEASSSHQVAGAQGGSSCRPAPSTPPTRQDGSLYHSVLPAFLKLSMRTIRLAHRLKIVMVPRHIAGQLNMLADIASRTGQVIPSEWSLEVIPMDSQSITVGSVTSGHIRKPSKSQI